MTDEDAVERARELLSKITPGPWRVQEWKVDGVKNMTVEGNVPGFDEVTIAEFSFDPDACRDDAAFIAESPSLVATLLERLEAAEAREGSLRDTNEVLRTDLQAVSAAAESLHKREGSLRAALELSTHEADRWGFETLVLVASLLLKNYPDNSVVSSEDGDPGARFTWHLRRGLAALSSNPSEEAPK